jgi:acetyltransferase-like isoleucine patch superfamily enzyme
LASLDESLTRLSVVLRDVRFGKRVTVVEPSNIYGCSIGDDSFIGPFCEVQEGATIGRRCRVQSHTFICEMVTIGDDCRVSHGVIFTNDPFKDGPAMGDRSKWRPTFVGNGVSIGSGATILPVSICDGTVIGAGSVVTKDIEIPGVYAGNPARWIRSR